MRQIWIPKIGTPDVLEVREAADPTPAAGEVRIRVEASGINFADIMARMGLYPDAPPLPAVVGYEVSGIIDTVGSGVQGYHQGDRVLSLCRFGGYSDVVCVPAANVVALPDSLGFEAAAGIPVNYLTAWLMLVELGHVQAKHTVLIHAAAGGVGQAALQICKDVGATVIGTASAGKHDRLTHAGVAHCIDYRNQDFEAETLRLTDGRGVDIVLDAVGGDSFNKSYRCLGALGRLFMFGASSFAPGQKRSIISAVAGLLRLPKFKAIPLMDANKGVFGVNLGHLWDRGQELSEMTTTIVHKVAAGAFTPVIDKSFSFEEAAAAHRYIQERSNFGKVVLTP